MKEFKILITDFKKYYMLFQDACLNDEDKVLPFLDYLNENNMMMNFILIKTKDDKYITSEDKNEIIKNDNKTNDIDFENKKKKKELESKGNFYFSEIAYLEAELKIKRINEENKLFKQGQGVLYNNLVNIGKKLKKKKQKIADDLKIRNENFLDPEDKYFNVKEFCFEIQKLEWEEKKKKEETIRKEIAKKDDPIVVTYNDVFHFRLKESIYFYIYLFFLMMFIFYHKFSKIDNSIKYNIYSFFEDTLFRNSLYKNILGKATNDLSIEEFDSDNIFNSKKKFIIFQSLILNNIFSTYNASNDYDKFNEILLSDDYNNSHAFYNAFRHAQFNYKFSKRYIFRDDSNKTNSEKKRVYNTSQSNQRKLTEFNKKFYNYCPRFLKKEENKNFTEFSSFLRNYYEEELNINQQRLFNFLKNFIPKVSLKEGYSMDLSDSMVFNDKEDNYFPIMINLNLKNETNVLNQKLLEFLKNKKLNKIPDSFIFDESNRDLEIYFQYNPQNNQKMKGKLRDYKNTGFKVYYDFSEHEPTLYNNVSQSILNNLFLKDELRYANIDLLIKHNKFNLPIRILVSFERSTFDYIYFQFKIFLLDFKLKKYESSVF